MPTNRTSDAAARGKGRPRAFDRGLALHRALEVFWQQAVRPAPTGYAQSHAHHQYNHSAAYAAQEGTP
mgnify:CR=1 FL=1